MINKFQRLVKHIFPSPTSPFSYGPSGGLGPVGGNIVSSPEGPMHSLSTQQFWSILTGKLHTKTYVVKSYTRQLLPVPLTVKFGNNGKMLIN